MSYQKRLDQAFENVPVLPLDDNHKYVVFSDCHRGSGNNNDNFIKNEHLYLAALRHYNRMQYTYVELGDGDELWENRKMEQILEVHNRAFEQLALFYRDDRLYMVYGNHDMVKKNASFCNKKCQLFYSVTKQCHNANDKNRKPCSKPRTSLLHENPPSVVFQSNSFILP